MPSVASTPNVDRYTRCASCRATADAILHAVNDDGTVRMTEKIERFAILEPVTIIDGQYVRGDRVTQVPIQVSTCARHAVLNAKRLIDSEV